jgi:hypothetical protein
MNKEEKIRNANNLKNLITKKKDSHLKNINKWLENLPVEALEKFSEIHYQIDKEKIDTEQEYKNWIIVGINDHLFFQKIKDEEIQNDEMWESVIYKNLLIKMEQEDPTYTHHLFEQIAYTNKLLDFMDKNIEERFLFYKIDLEANPIYK